MRKRKRFRPRRISMRGIAPNVVTMLALAAGMTSLKFALQGQWELAVFAVVLAGIFDGIDGSIARLLRSASRFGAELDSLSDMVSFGVAPAVVLYLWALSALGGLGWVIALAFAVCCALRLARYNSALDDDDEPRKKAGFLTGFPAPVGAGLVLLPMMLQFEYELEFFRSPEFVGVWTAIIALGLVARVPTFSFRQMIIQREQMVAVLLAVGLFAAALTVYQWIVLVLVSFSYLISVPLSMRKYRAVAKAQENEQADKTPPEA